MRRYQEILKDWPTHNASLYHLALARLQRKETEEGRVLLEKLAVIAPTHVGAHWQLALLHQGAGRDADALIGLERALALEPKNIAIWRAKALSLFRLNRLAEALSSYEDVLAIAPHHVETLSDQGAVLHLLKRFDEALASFEKALASDPHYVEALYNRAITLKDLNRLDEALASCDQALKINPEHADVLDHRGSVLLALKRFEEALASYDRAIAINPRHANAWNNQARALLDLKGYTHDARPGILAHRPAPIQVGFLGYPGTTGAAFIDYVIADRIVLPFDQQPHYAEKIVHLPECYQVNDSRRRIAGSAPTRNDAGLPDDAFVFCSFNNNYKITPPVFDVWMRLLHAVDGSVLWLLRDNDGAERNLRKEAAVRGIDPGRLVFAGRMQLDQHLARHRVADLFLDTLPVNAHTTASDALWAGLPLITWCGEAFAGRVAASLLTAVGLPELVTHSLDDYEALALKLATDARAARRLSRAAREKPPDRAALRHGSLPPRPPSSKPTSPCSTSRGQDEPPRSFSVDGIKPPRPRKRSQ